MALKNITMHITMDEAISLLDTWREENVPLIVYFSRPGASEPGPKLDARVTEIRGATVKFASGSQEIDVDLSGAEFNGDRRGPLSGDHGAYLICEFRNDDRWSFYAPRIHSSIPETERRQRLGKG